MYDVIVVGARCAGAPTAMLLARKGYRVLLVDRATFPSEIPHGHFIHRQGPRRLHQWGLLDRVVAGGCPPVTSFTLDFGDFPLTGRDLALDGVAFAYGPRRGVFDKLLVDAASDAGAEVREGFVVDNFTTEADRITGIRGRESRGSASSAEHATVIVGADGRNSRLAHTVGATAYETAPVAMCWYFSYWSGVPDNGLELYVRDRQVILAFPTNADLVSVAIGWSAEQFPIVRSDLEGKFMAAVAQIPALAERVRAGRREEQFYGASDLPNFVRKPYGPGWALVGDAGCHKDPFLALGICDALRDAELLAESLDQGLSGARPLDEALANYERHRNAATSPGYRENLQLAQFQPLPTEMYRLRAALRGNQDATRQFFMAFEGLIPPESFFNPENLQGIMAAAPPAVGAT